MITKTPVMAGIIKTNAPPETPFLTADAKKSTQTPVMESFNVIKTTVEG